MPAGTGGGLGAGRTGGEWVHKMLWVIISQIYVWSGLNFADVCSQKNSKEALTSFCGSRKVNPCWTIVAELQQWGQNSKNTPSCIALFLGNPNNVVFQCCHKEN